LQHQNTPQKAITLYSHAFFYIRSFFRKFQKIVIFTLLKNARPYSNIYIQAQLKSKRTSFSGFALAWQQRDAL
jgi:hypothetical protein